jgi:leader peptidase (prepilin peptidase)/N-methyltransferase
MPLNGRSKCPYCNTQILARHNLPVLGWLALRGRCYTCRLPISPRYPIVEAFVAFCFLWVGWHEIYNNIANLPLEQVARRQSALAIFRPTPFTIGIGSFHLLGITCLIALGLTRLDGQKLPSKLIGFALVSALIPVLVWPRLLQVPATLTVPDGWNPQKADLGDAVMFQICSLAMSVFLAKLIGIGLLPTANLKFDPQLPDSQRLLDLVAGLSLCGLLVGWQATLAVTPWALLIAWLISHYSPGTRRFDIVGRLLLALALAVTLQIAHWYGLSQLPVWPFPDHSQWSYVLPIAATMLLTRIPWPAPTSAPWHANSSSLARAAANHPAAMLAESTGPDEAEVDESTH